ncbi:hypothetical protein ACN28E_22375 [Archangium lansingense]|uniref:hypothetical protein n=1 Tax=Archangium lansingense TaxID=2995310 RepID=UPI003B7B9EA1
MVASQTMAFLGLGDWDDEGIVLALLHEPAGQFDLEGDGPAISVIGSLAKQREPLVAKVTNEPVGVRP